MCFVGELELGFWPESYIEGLTSIEGPGLSSNGFFPLLLIGIRGFPVVISLLKVGELQGRVEELDWAGPAQSERTTIMKSVSSSV